MSGDLKSQRWKTEDVVDFEYFRMKDDGVFGEALEIRDRAIFKDFGKPQADRRELFRYWVRRRRVTHSGGILPSTLVVPVFSTVAILLMLAGLISGGSAAYATLQYDGSVPVNVSIFWGILIVPQMALMIALLLVALIGVLFPGFMPALYRGPTSLLMAISRWLWGWFLKIRKVSAENRDDIRWSIRVFSELVRQHRGIAAARAFALIQRFGVFFNIGILLTSGLLLMFTDRAFGWQSSLTDSPRTVSSIVKMVAAPWRELLGEGIGYPSPGQIEGSRIILRENGQLLDSHDLTAWWPFLLLGIVFYGLIPRMLAWAFAGFLETRSLHNTRFRSFLYNPLWERMHSVTLQSSGDKAAASVVESELSMPVEDTFTADQFHVWIPEEIRSRYPYEELSRHLEKSGHGSISGLSECKGNRDDLPSVTGSNPLLLVEGWLPPIQEKLDQLKSIAQSVEPNDQSLYLLLIGKPTNRGWKAMKPEMLEIWRKKVKLLGIENLRLLKNPVEGAELG